MTSAAALVLAAGGSSRLGRPKQLLEVGGRTLLAGVIDIAIAAKCSPIVVVLGRDADACRETLGDRDIITVLNADWTVGLGTSIRAGVRTLLDAVPETDRLILMLGDQPNVTEATLDRLVAAADASGKPVAVASYADTVGPPVLAGGAFLRLLADWPEDRGAKDLWLADPTAVVRVSCPEAADDIDTQADYERLIAGRAR